MNKRNAIIFGLLLALIGIEIVVIAPNDASPPATDGSHGDGKALNGQKDGSGVGQAMTDVHLVEAKPAGKEWELWAKRAVRSTDDTTWTIEDVNVKFFAANGAYYTVTGKRGKVSPNKNDMQILGNVVTHSSNGYVFKTESALYDSRAKRLLSPEKVEMTGPKDSVGGALFLTGSEMLVDVPSDEMRIGRDVRARKKIKGDRVATIVSRSAFFSGKSNQARFVGDVVIDVDSLRVTGPEARFIYKSGSDFIESMVVQGGVKVTDVDKMATSDQVSVRFDSEKIVFSGSPKLMQNGDELSGEEIVFLQGGRKVQVNNARAKLDANEGITAGPGNGKVSGPLPGAPPKEMFR